MLMFVLSTLKWESKLNTSTYIYFNSIIILIRHDIALTYIKNAVEILDETYMHKFHLITDFKE